MSDLISRQAAIDAADRADYTGLTVEDVKKVTDEVVKEIKKLPSAEPERKTGEWIYGEKDGSDGWYCSECRGFVPWDYDYYGLDNIDFIKDFKTCPLCDARMISHTGDDEDEDK